MEEKEPIKFDSEDQEQPSDGNSALSYLQSELEVVREENVKLHWEVNSLVKDMQRLRSQPSSAEEDLVVIQDENEQLRSQVVKMIKDMDGLQKELNTVRDTSGSTEGLKKIQSELDVAKAENEKLHYAAEEKIEEVNKLQERLTKAKHRFDLGKAEFEKLRSQEVQKTEELTKLQGELKGYQEKFELAKAENEKLGSQESAKSEELAKLHNELKAYQEKVSLTKIENEKLHSQESGKSAELAELRSELKENQEKLNVVQAESEKWRLQEKEKLRELTKLKTELSGYSEKFELSKAENENLIAQKKEEFEVVDTLTSELKSSSEKLDLLKVEKEKLLLQDGAKSDELKKLQTEYSKLLGQLDEVKAEKKKVNAKDLEKLDEFESLKLELESARKELAIEKNKPVKLNVRESDSKKQEAELKNTREALDLEKNKNKALNLQLKNQEKEIQKLSDQVVDGRTKEQVKSKREGIKVDEKAVNQDDSKPDIIDYKVKQDETPTARVGKFRKYQGYRNPEEKKEEGSASLLDLVKEYRDRMANGESLEEIALSIAQLNPEKLQGEEESDETSDKSKAYSPNRSFGDLLEDSERRQVASVQRVEAGWSDDDKDAGKAYVEGSNYQDLESMPEKSSIKPLLVAGVLAAVALGIGGSLLFSDKGDDSTVISEEDVVVTPADTQTGEDNTVIVENTDGASTDGVSATNVALDLTSDTLKEDALNILRDFHGAKELEKKASFCRVPVRTLATMKSYYTGGDDTITVAGLRIAPELVTLGDLKLVKADVITKIGDVIGARLAFFEIDSEGELKLDWFNYIDSEAGTWDKYTQSDAITSKEWKVKLDFDGDEHPDFLEEEYAAVRVRSFSPDAINVVNAYIKKSDPKYQDLIDAYQTGQQVFILKLRNLMDETGSFIVDEIISLHSFYPVDVVSTE